MDNLDLNKNIRSITDLDDTELRESMNRFGWLKQFPAYADENGVLIVGHRRMKIAPTLGIEPVVQTITFGNGSDADAERLGLAIASNIGAAALSKKDRERIATLAYKHGYSQKSIAKLLGVSQKTISKDLDGIYTEGINQKPAKTASNPRGAGRPRGSGRGGGRPRGSGKKTTPQLVETEPVRTPAAKPRTKSNGESKTPVLDRARNIVRPMVWNGMPLASRKLEVETGISHVHLETAWAVEVALKDEPPIDAATLSLTAQEKLDIATKAARRKLVAEFDTLMQQQLRDNMKSAYAYYQEKCAEYELVIERRSGVMKAAEYRAILACLHPDRVQDSTLKKRYEHAFNLFAKYKLRLLDESEGPSSKDKLPETFEEWEALKAKATAERKAARAAKQQANAVQR